MTAPLCEYAECAQPAEAQLTGHWTMVDWFDVEVCADHVYHMWNLLKRRRVDGQQIAGVTLKYYSGIL